MRLCDKNLIWTFKNVHTEKTAGGGRPSHTLSQFLPGPSHEPSAHQRPLSPCPEEQRVQRRVRTQIKDSEKGTVCSGPSQGCSRGASAPVSSCDTHHDELTLEHLSNKEGVTAIGYGTRYGMQGKNILELHKMYYGMCRGETKGRQREGSGFGEEKAWEKRRIRGWKCSVTCQQRLLGTFVCLCLMSISTVCFISLLNSISNFFLAWGSPFCVYGGLSASSWSETSLSKGPVCPWSSTWSECAWTWEHQQRSSWTS